MRTAAWREVREPETAGVIDRLFERRQVLCGIQQDAKQDIDPFTSFLLGFNAMGSAEFQIAVIPNHGSLVSNLLVLGLLLSPSG